MAGLRCAVAMLVLVLAAGMGSASRAADVLRTAPLRVFDATQLTPDAYTVVRRLWVDSWRSALLVPTHPDPAAAIAELSTRAIDAGADALINVTCLDDRGAWFAPGYFCYGLAIKLK